MKYPTTNELLELAASCLKGNPVFAVECWAAAHGDSNAMETVAVALSLQQDEDEEDV